MADQNSGNQALDSSPDTLGGDADAFASSTSDPFKLAYRRHEQELAALDDDELLVINLDVPGAIVTALGVAAEVRDIEEQLATVPDFDIRQLDDLPSYARALSYANTMVRVATEPVDDIKPIYDEALALRETLGVDVRALIHRGLINGKRIEELTGNVGYKNVAIDLQILAVVLRQSWESIETRSAATPADIQRAVDLADQLLLVTGIREQSDVNVTEASDARTRAYTLFMRAYDDVRRVVSHVRWKHGDADRFAPSLYAGRTKKKSPKSDLPTATPAAPAAEASGAAPAAPPTNGAAPSAASAQGPFAE